MDDRTDADDMQQLLELTKQAASVQESLLANVREFHKLACHIGAGEDPAVCELAKLALMGVYQRSDDAECKGTVTPTLSLYAFIQKNSTDLGTATPRELGDALATEFRKQTGRDPCSTIICTGKGSFPVRVYCADWLHAEVPAILDALQQWG